MFLDLMKGFLIISFVMMMFFKLFKNDKLNLLFKMLTSLCLVVLSIYLASNQHASRALLIVIGMLFGAVGDLLLGLKVSDFVKESCKGVLLLTGFIAFAIGHVFYLSYFYLVRCLRPLDLVLPFLGSFIIIVCILLFKHLKIMDYGKFLVPCMAYGYLLLFVVLTTFIDAVKFGLSWPVFAGFLLFIISDLILMVIYFSPKDKTLKCEDEMLLTFFNLITYFSAQYIIIHMCQMNLANFIA